MRTNCTLCGRSVKLLMKLGEDENSFFACEQCAKEVGLLKTKEKLGQHEFSLGEPISVIRNGCIVTQYRDISGRYRLLKTVTLSGSVILTDNSGFQFNVLKGDVESMMKCWKAFVSKQVSFHDFRLIQEVLS